MTYEDIFFYAKRHYKIIILVTISFLLLVTTLFAKNNEEEEIKYPKLTFPEIPAAPEDEKEELAKVYVDLKGAVVMQGVYQMTSNSRIIDVINMAGGLAKEADTLRINLSQKLRDEMVIIIPNIDDEKEDIEEYEEITKDAGEAETNNLICLSTASLDQLTTLPGIGPARAQDIINYRLEHGFSQISDVMNVTGIGEATFEQIKDLVKV